MQEKHKIGMIGILKYTGMRLNRTTSPKRNPPNSLGAVPIAGGVSCKERATSCVMDVHQNLLMLNSSGDVYPFKLPTLQIW